VLCAVRSVVEDCYVRPSVDRYDVAQAMRSTISKSYIQKVWCRCIVCARSNLSCREVQQDLATDFPQNLSGGFLTTDNV
jgi:hypothetical protein